ncbi:MAG: diaminopimelate epimerase, partial [Gammaproteobacteria bacterium]
MAIAFTKMQGLGNDFVMIDAVSQDVSLTAQQIRKLADRHLGIGCDQVLLVERAKGDADFRYRVFNADGGEVEQCGNGARCFVQFVRMQGLTDKSEIAVETAGGTIRPRIEADGRITVNMGIPRFAPRDIPFKAERESLSYELLVNDTTLTIGVVSMGNPHAVVRVDSVREAPVDTLGPLLEKHPRFPRRVNVGFMEIVAPGHIRLRVYERGAGETLACGTGACAAVAVGRRWGLLEESVNVELPGGNLTIRWQGDNNSVWMTGP